MRTWWREALLIVGLASLAVRPGGGSAPTPPDDARKQVSGTSSLEARVRREEYRPSLQRGVPSAPNRAHGLRMRWDAAGTRIEDRTSGEHLATMKTTRVGRQKPAALEPGEAELHDGHVTRRWAEVTEWWRNDEAGVEQGWTVETRPEGAGALRLVVEVEGAAVTSDGDGILLQTQTGRRLAYGKLKAWDAHSRRRHSRLEGQGLPNRLWLRQYTHRAPCGSRVRVSLPGCTEATLRSRCRGSSTLCRENGAQPFQQPTSVQQLQRPQGDPVEQKLHGDRRDEQAHCIRPPAPSPANPMLANANTVITQRT